MCTKHFSAKLHDISILLIKRIEGKKSIDFFFMFFFSSNSCWFMDGDSKRQLMECNAIRLVILLTYVSKRRHTQCGVEKEEEEEENVQM